MKVAMVLHLNNNPFNNIKSGNKIIEMRLYDEKRRKLKENDIIEFINRENHESIKVKIIKLHLFNNFEELYKAFNKIELGYKDNDIASPEDMNIYYSKKEQEKYGVVGIEIKLI